MTNQQLPSPKGQTGTAPAHITSDLFGVEGRMFECPAPGPVYQREVGLPDPLNLAEIGGWLRGELRARPT